jgi:hypothetical protein
MGQTPCTEGEHDFKEVTIREATCTYKGEVRHECTKCDYEYLSEIKAKKHEFTVTQGPLEEGEKGFYADMTFVCRNCDFSYVEKQLIIAHLCNHKVKEVIQEQEETCETAGFKVYKCKATDCGEEWSETIEALGHEYFETVIPPTDTAQGYTEHTCSVCGDTYRDNYVSKDDGQPTPSPAVAVSGVVVSFGSETEAVTVKVLDGAKKVVAETVSVANGAYQFEKLEAGQYTLVFSKTDHADREYSITVGSEAVVLDARIQLFGDVDGDGKVTAKDQKIYFNHINEVNKLTGYEFTVGDVDLDGKVNAKDKKMIYNHIKGVSLLW